MDWLTAHWDDVLGILTGVVTVASLVVKLTPTPKDDKAVAKVWKLLDTLALNPKQKK